MYLYPEICPNSDKDSLVIQSEKDGKNAILIATPIG